VCEFVCECLCLCVCVFVREQLQTSTMAVDYDVYAAAIDKKYECLASQEVHSNSNELRSLTEKERQNLKCMEKQFQEKLNWARGAFLQEFRNHSVVVESEVRKIREELTQKMEAQYAEKLNALRKQAEDASSIAQKYKDEIMQLKALITAQEAYLVAVRHRCGPEQTEKFKTEILNLKSDLDQTKKENADLAHQLICQDELVTQLGSDVAALERKLRNQETTFGEENQAHQEKVRNLQGEMQQQREHFQARLLSYEEQFAAFKEKTTAELQLQDILNNRRSDALGRMEEERQRHIKARTKPTPRIGPAGELETEQNSYTTYELSKSARYRTDEMGMDTSWRDYQMNDLNLVPERKPLPTKFRVERSQRDAVPSAAAMLQNVRPIPHIRPLLAGATAVLDPSPR